MKCYIAPLQNPIPMTDFWKKSSKQPGITKIISYTYMNNMDDMDKHIKI